MTKHESVPATAAARRPPTVTFKGWLAARPLTREHVGVVFKKAVLLPRLPRADPLPLTEYKKIPATQGGRAKAEPSRSCIRFTSPATKGDRWPVKTVPRIDI